MKSQIKFTEKRIIFEHQKVDEFSTSEKLTTEELDKITFTTAMALINWEKKEKPGLFKEELNNKGFIKEKFSDGSYLLRCFLQPVAADVMEEKINESGGDKSYITRVLQKIPLGRIFPGMENMYFTVPHFIDEPVDKNENYYAAIKTEENYSPKEKKKIFRPQLRFKFKTNGEVVIYYSTMGRNLDTKKEIEYQESYHVILGEKNKNYFIKKVIDDLGKEDQTKFQLLVQEIHSQKLTPDLKTKYDDFWKFASELNEKPAEDTNDYFRLIEDYFDDNNVLHENWWQYYLLTKKRNDETIFDPKTLNEGSFHLNQAKIAAKRLGFDEMGDNLTFDQFKSTMETKIKLKKKSDMENFLKIISLDGNIDNSQTELKIEQKEDHDGKSLEIYLEFGQEINSDNKTITVFGQKILIPKGTKKIFFAKQKEINQWSLAYYGEGTSVNLLIPDTTKRTEVNFYSLKDDLIKPVCIDLEG